MQFLNSKVPKTVNVGGDVGLELGADVGGDVQTGFMQGSSSGFSFAVNLKAAQTHKLKLATAWYCTQRRSQGGYSFN